ncbi:hypothetical protein F2P81_002126 [Scophthalmus maximus]|uniref:Uncharacterized protein n=1 Tax=Scophthalmus maximus TaxID=52904 RepID=A0A6A4TG11_SCOMX|nr:hypothetical protein F2P81_002126 [Scophthalmus maximus]
MQRKGGGIEVGEKTTEKSSENKEREGTSDLLSSNFLSLSPSPTGVLGKSHTHQIAGSVPDEQARKENINEAPQPFNT